MQISTMIIQIVKKEVGEEEKRERVEKDTNFLQIFEDFLQNSMNDNQRMNEAVEVDDLKLRFEEDEEVCKL